MRMQIRKVVYHILCGEEGYDKQKVEVDGALHNLIMKHARTLEDLAEFLDQGKWSKDEGQ